jgi:hypothetical protein
MMAMSKKSIEEAETHFIDKDVVSEIEFKALTKRERERVVAFHRWIEIEHTERFVSWFMDLPNGGDVKIGVAVHSETQQPNAVVVQHAETTWFFPPTEVLVLIQGLEMVSAKWTAVTGKSAPAMERYLIHGLRICFNKMLSIPPEEIEEMEENLTTDEYGRQTFDHNKRRI